VCTCVAAIAQIAMRMILIDDGVVSKDLPEDKDITAAFTIADSDKSGECT